MSYDTLAVVLGNCLFENHDDLVFGKTLFFMKEDRMLCTHFKYHKHKIIHFLSSMRSHRDELKKIYDVTYFEFDDKSYIDRLKEVITNNKIKNLSTYEIEDKFMRELIVNFCKEQKISLKIINSPGFLTSQEEFSFYLQKNKLFMQSFYIWQRKRLNILLDDKEKPIGGKWSFDADNRKPLPKKIELPEISFPKHTKHTQDIILLVEKEFKDHPGGVDNFYLPTTRKDALVWFDNFLETRFKLFGDYEDAISKEKVFLFHSILSPLINIGLLTPKEVINKAVKKEDIPLNSLEGFLRQIIGWREFIRGCYNNVDYSTNFFNHKRKLSKKFYDATTNITPVDDSIKKATKYGYTHHIERLMILSNFMLLCEIDPEDVYKWFMELFVDSSDWVMVPNVYGMGQFANDSFATKPYISGSSYVLKMSDYEKEDWCDIWDGLYWRFIDKKRDFFKSNPRMAVMVAMFDKMKSERKNYILKRAESFLETL